MARQYVRLPTDARNRAIALVERSLPNPDIEPTPQARERRKAANDRAVLYAVQDELSDSLIRLAEKVDDMDGACIEVDEEADKSIRHHIGMLEDVLHQQ
jgi:hypothetical protein